MQEGILRRTASTLRSRMRRRGRWSRAWGGLRPWTWRGGRATEAHCPPWATCHSSAPRRCWCLLNWTASVCRQHAGWMAIVRRGLNEYMILNVRLRLAGPGKCMYLAMNGICFSKFSSLSVYKSFPALRTTARTTHIAPQIYKKIVKWHMYVYIPRIRRKTHGYPREGKEFHFYIIGYINKHC